MIHLFVLLFIFLKHEARLSRAVDDITKPFALHSFSLCAHTVFHINCTKLHKIAGAFTRRKYTRPLNEGFKDEGSIYDKNKEKNSFLFYIRYKRERERERRHTNNAKLCAKPLGSSSSSLQ